MFTYQENTHFSQALPCTKEVFWEQVKKPNTAWRIDARRAIIAAVDASKTQGVAAIQTWLDSADYQKFLLKKQNLKKKSKITPQLLSIAAMSLTRLLRVRELPLGTVALQNVTLTVS